MPTTTVHLVDDDASFLRATSRMLVASGYRVAAFESAAAFTDSLSPDTSGCVVADLAMPEMDGIGLQEALVNHRSRLPVVFLTGNGDIPTTVLAMRRGAVDFLTKTASRQDLITAIERALEKHAREQESRDRLADLRRRFDALSPRETEVLSHVVRGQLNKQIAAALGIHERTVKLHRTAVTTKLGVQSAAELAVLAREAGIFDEVPTFPNGQ